MKPDVYEAMVECASSVCADAAEAAAELELLRDALRDAGATLAGAGLHPTAAHGDVVHVAATRATTASTPRCAGCVERTPTCALHVHVGMPDAETAIAVFNRLRGYLPLLQALAAHSPFWYGRDSGFATARAQLFRGFPRAVIPRPFADWDDYATTAAAWVAAGALPDYTYLWWDIRPHPRLGTVEVRAMDAQSRLGTVAGLAALVHALAAACADGHGSVEPAEALTESSFRAGRDGLARHDLVARRACGPCARWPTRRWRSPACTPAATRSRRSSASCATATAPTACATRTRSAGMPAVLERLVREAAEPLYGYTRTTVPMRTQL